MKFYCGPEFNSIEEDEILVSFDVKGLFSVGQSGRRIGDINNKKIHKVGQYMELCKSVQRETVLILVVKYIL